MDQQDSDSNNENQSCSSSDSNPCPICLAPFLQESYLDTCFHKFCYKCILQWTKVVSHKESRRPSSVKCPLCKTENFSLIYGYDGSSFQRHYVNQGFEDSSFFSKAHKYRLQCYYTEPGILNDCNQCITILEVAQVYSAKSVAGKLAEKRSSSSAAGLSSYLFAFDFYSLHFYLLHALDISLKFSSLAYYAFLNLVGEQEQDNYIL
ncbi:RING/U-BOX SUPERFAMILY PROTEIN [Salix purpurea]|uniref:RING/U-BOX SUPERFAMILY PROTEIN n=1 Tax=Salix purpurea TaxID=77065 RepID=A0A9Q0X040_SALPP|nr:RING/U-BOX SUPERFAMILY PROTEIN [Salix purpurea]